MRARAGVCARGKLWTKCEQNMNKMWTKYEQNMNKMWTVYEQLDKLTLCKNYAENVYYSSN